MTNNSTDLMQNREDLFHLPEEELQAVKDWFSRYVRSFYTPDPVLQPSLLLKEQHSRRVSNLILAIGGKLGLSDQGLRVAEVMGLLHDIGRFEQVTRYGTFVDRKSENHAELGLRVLEQEQVLATVADAPRQLIRKAISYHNRLAIPDGESEACLFYSRLLRDADKLDILALFSVYYHASPEERSTAVELDLPDEPGVSKEVLEDLQQGKAVVIGHLKVLNDFKLLQLGWVSDINFAPTLAILYERGYLRKIRDSLPASQAIDHIYSRILSDIEKRL